MNAVGYRFRSDLRRRWPAWLAVIVVLGVAFGTVMALAAGARRADTAVSRFLEQTVAADIVVVQGVPGIFDFAPVDLEEVAALPGVADSAESITLAVVGRTPEGEIVDSTSLNFNVDPAGRLGTDINRLKILEGRPADPTDPTEIVVPFRSAEQGGLAIGDVIEVNILDGAEQAQVFDPTSGVTTEDLLDPGSVDRLRVVGIAAVAGELAASAEGGELTNIYLTPAVLEANPEGPIVHSLAIRLKDGQEGVPEFLDRVQALADGQQVFSLRQSDGAGAAEQAISPVVRALWLSAGLVALVVGLIGGQVLARQEAAEGGDNTTLRALGLDRRQMLALRMAKAAVIAGPAAFVALGVALGLSPAFPVGLARIAEIDPGVSADGAVLAGGAVFVVVCLVVLAGARGWWENRRPVEPGGVVRRRRPSRLVATLARVGAPPPAVAGSRLASSSGSGGSSIVATAVTVALGLGTVAAVLVFTASLSHLRATPPLYGWSWDATLGQDFAVTLSPRFVEILRTDEAVGALAVGDHLELDLDGEATSVLGVDAVVGIIEPALLDGRVPTAVGEIVVRPELGDVGDRLAGSFGAETMTLDVVGTATLPSASAFTTFETVQRLAPEAAAQNALVRFRPGADVDAFLERVKAPPIAYSDEDVALPALTSDVVNFGRVDAAPLLIAGLMGLVALATLVHTLVLTVRQGRRDLAVLKAIGFTRGQVMAAVSWQATIVAVFAVVLAVPVGVAVGRWAWLTFAGELHVVPVAVVPPGLLVALGGATLVVANTVALLPAWRAASVPAGSALRAE